MSGSDRPVEFVMRATYVGAIVGFLAFLVFGLLPSLVYGGSAGLAFAGGIFGVPVVSTLWTRSLIVLGMVVFVIGAASLFMVMGAMVGALAGAALSPFVRSVPVPERAVAKGPKA